MTTVKKEKAVPQQPRQFPSLTPINKWLAKNPTAMFSMHSKPSKTSFLLANKNFTLVATASHRNPTTAFTEFMQKVKAAN